MPLPRSEARPQGVALKFSKPVPEATGVPTMNVKIAWRAVADVAHDIVKIEWDDLGTQIEATLPDRSLSFTTRK